jgi:hypothetical protein
MMASQSSTISSTSSVSITAAVVLHDGFSEFYHLFYE